MTDLHFFQLVRISVHLDSLLLIGWTPVSPPLKVFENLRSKSMNQKQCSYLLWSILQLIDRINLLRLTVVDEGVKPCVHLLDHLFLRLRLSGIIDVLAKDLHLDGLQSGWGQSLMLPLNWHR